MNHHKIYNIYCNYNKTLNILNKNQIDHLKCLFCDPIELQDRSGIMKKNLNWGFHLNSSLRMGRKLSKSQFLCRIPKNSIECCISKNAELLLYSIRSL